jgi:N-methylhydantoinase A
MRFAVDTGGTFTDLVIDDGAGALRLFKAPTTPADPLDGLLDVFAVAATELGTSRADLLGSGSTLVYGTTRSINAVITGTTARTAFLTTAGHPDILLFREGGRPNPFDYTRAYPPPYVPRSLTFELPGRLDYAGAVVRELDEAALLDVVDRMRRVRVEAVGVCLLWSIVNPAHELRVADVLERELPGVPYTLSHELNPTLREYRRASSTCIDASLKPLMTEHLTQLEERVRAAGFGGTILMSTTNGGTQPVAVVARKPILSLNSGPAMAPVAGRYYAAADSRADTAIVADTGGTTFDVSVVRDGRLPRTRETWLGQQFIGHITGFPSVDVRSVGAGGGSIARVDAGGRLHVGPQSAGADPGPVCFGKGGVAATVTDACVVLGYLDADYFAGGDLRLDATAAEAAIREQVAEPLGIDVSAAAAAVLEVATELMVRAIEDVTLQQGIDPRSGVLVGGGGAAGLNAVAIARRLGCGEVVIPEVGAALSAAGALMSDLSADYAITHSASTARFDAEGVNAAIEQLRSRASEAYDLSAPDVRAELVAEARYPHQVWDIELPVAVERFTSDADVERLKADFHAAHRDLFAVDDRDSDVELLTWRLRVTRVVSDGTPARLASATDARREPRVRLAHFAGAGSVETPVVAFEDLVPDAERVGPLIVESPVTTVVVDPGATIARTASGSLRVVLADRMTTVEPQPGVSA